MTESGEPGRGHKPAPLLYRGDDGQRQTSGVPEGDYDTVKTESLISGFIH